MSKLIESMHDVCLNKQKLINTPVRLSVEEKVYDLTVSSALDIVTTGYDCKVEIGLRGQVVDKEDLGRLRTDARRNIAEFAFGEFRNDFRAIDVALWDRDFDLAKKLLREMEQRMFEI